MIASQKETPPLASDIAGINADDVAWIETDPYLLTGVYVSTGQVLGYVYRYKRGAHLARVHGYKSSGRQYGTAAGAQRAVMNGLREIVSRSPTVARAA